MSTHVLTTIADNECPVCHKIIKDYEPVVLLLRTQIWHMSVDQAAELEVPETDLAVDDDWTAQSVIHARCNSVVLS